MRFSVPTARSRTDCTARRAAASRPGRDRRGGMEHVDRPEREEKDCTAYLRTSKLIEARLHRQAGSSHESDAERGVSADALQQAHFRAWIGHRPDWPAAGFVTVCVAGRAARNEANSNAPTPSQNHSRDSCVRGAKE